MFANDLEDQESVLVCVITKTQKWYTMPPCLTVSIIRYGSRIKWRNPGNGVAPSPTPRCNSYWKGSLQVSVDYDRQLYIYIYIYIYIYEKHFYTVEFISIYIYICIYQPLHMNRMRHKAIFSMFEFKVFLLLYWLIYRG